MRLFLTTCLVMIAFAANSVLNRMAVFGAGWDPALVGVLRLGAGAVVLCLLSGIRLRHPPPPAMLALGVATLFLYIWGFSRASGRLDAGVGALTLFGTVQITMFGAAVFRKTHIPPLRWLGAGMALAGLAVLLWPQGDLRIDMTGLAWMMAAGMGWGLYSLNGAKARDALTATAFNFALATPLALLWWLGAGSPMAGASYGLWATLASGAITSGLGYALWYRVLPQIPATQAALAQLSVPLIAALGGAVFLAELPGPRFWLAGALVLGGIGLGLLRR
ncbi:DMT family transporter [Thioclava sp. GXIMD4216]|uniref:DMT family transporter n=1 Tax=Thioclava sp. GXIMD4216 TaxID=3131929 RepID=UPI0030CDB2D4